MVASSCRALNTVLRSADIFSGSVKNVGKF